MFGRSITAQVPAALLPGLLARVNQLAAPRLRRDGRFIADYWRLRFVAVAEADEAKPAKLHLQTA